MNQFADFRCIEFRYFSTNLRIIRYRFYMFDYTDYELPANMGNAFLNVIFFYCFKITIRRIRY